MGSNLCQRISNLLNFSSVKLHIQMLKTFENAKKSFPGWHQVPRQGATFIKNLHEEKAIALNHHLLKSHHLWKQTPLARTSSSGCSG